MSKVVLVTGGARGIGAAIIREMAKAGYDCIIHYNTSESDAINLQKEISAYNVKSMIVKTDIASEIEVNEMFSKITKVFKGVDILVNNAAVDLSDIFSNKTSEIFERTLNVNVVGAFNVSRNAASFMVNNKWGRIINISSTNGMNTYYPICLEYDASKAALNSLTHNLAIQYAPYVNVNAIAPGFIGTDSELADYDEEFLKLEQDKILVKRFGNPMEVAKLVKFLASDDAAYINNTIIRIDGGQYGSN